MRHAMTTLNDCLGCGCAVVPLKEIHNGWFVSSDCKPLFSNAIYMQCPSCLLVQKARTKHWDKIVSNIYDDYQNFRQSGGREPVLDVADFLTRSDFLVDIVEEHLGIRGSRGSVYEIGSGNGFLLQKLALRLPHLKLGGFDPNPDMKSRNFYPRDSAFYTSLHIDALQGADVIIMNHVLEHLTQPRDLLRQISASINPDSLLVIQVPNFEESPFDIYVYDHVCHFTRASLEEMLASSGLMATIKAAKSPKDLTYLCKKSDSDIPAKTGFYPKNKKELFYSHFSDTQEFARQIDSINAPKGVFGTGISSTWLASRMRQPPSCFLDEDPYRANSLHLGIPVVHPSEVDDSLLVIVPQPSALSRQIKIRLARDYGLSGILVL